MNNYCRNCGEKLTDFTVCEKCGTKILKNRVGEPNRVLEKKYIRIFFIMLILYFICHVIIFRLPDVLPYEYVLDAYVLYDLISPIINFLPLALIIFVIFAKEELKYSKFFNIVFWIMLLLIILFILFILFTLISCEYKF